MQQERENNIDAAEIKSCCANVYQSDLARLLLGDSFHPGGISLTEHLGALLHLGPEQRVLDVASGQGSSAIALAQRYGCQVLGIDYAAQAAMSAAQAATEAGVTHLVTFLQGDAECLPVPDKSFDAIICECALCTFPNKAAAVAEWWRVLKAGGQVGLSDLTRDGAVPETLQGLFAWIACIADAQPVSTYTRYLTMANFTIKQLETHNEALQELVQQIRAKLLSVELLVKIKKLDLPPSLDFEQAKVLAKAAMAAIQMHKFGYIVLVASK